MSFGPFSVLPNGLPNFFGLTGQATPKAMEEIVRSTLDLLPWLAQANCQEVIVPANFNVNAVGTTNIPELTVPGGEGWLVLGATLGATTGAAELIRMRMLAIRGPTTSPNTCPYRLLAEGATTISGAAGGAQIQVTSEVEPFLLYPGDNIGVNVVQITTAGNITISSRAVVFRFAV